MSRPRCPRRIECRPDSNYFKPRGIPMSDLEEILLEADEMESLRLADFEGLYHEKAAKKMGISRPTFGRILESARKKVATALVKGNALHIQTDMKTPAQKAIPPNPGPASS